MENYPITKAKERIMHEFFEELQSIKEYINDQLRKEIIKKDCNGLYKIIQIEMCYNSNKIEGSLLSKEQVTLIQNTGKLNNNFSSKDIEEANGHFEMFSYMIDTLEEPLTQEMIKEFHHKLKDGVWEDQINGYAVGDYKKIGNIVGNMQTVKPEEVEREMKSLLDWYDNQEKTLDILSEFHIRYEHIHPFQDGNGRTGRIILFRECLVNKIMPFIIQDDNKFEYYEALREKSIEKMKGLFIKEQFSLEMIVNKWLENN